MAPRGLDRAADRRRVASELTRANTPLESLGAGLLMFGPFALALGGPLAVALVRRHFGIYGMHYEWLIPVDVVTLLVGGYLGVVNALLGGLSGASGREKALRAVPVVPLATIATAEPDGLVFVEGTVATQGEQVRGPLTGRTAVWAETWVHVTRPSERGPMLARTARATDVVPFVVEDGHGGRVRVEPEGGALENGRTLEQRSCASGDFDGYQAALARAGVTVGPREDASVVEDVLRPGERVTVLGVVRRGDGYREGPSVSLVGDAEDRLHVYVGSREGYLGALRVSSSRRLWNVLGLATFAVGIAIPVAFALGVA